MDGEGEVRLCSIHSSRVRFCRHGGNGRWCAASDESEEQWPCAPPLSKCGGGGSNGGAGTNGEGGGGLGSSGIRKDGDPLPAADDEEDGAGGPPAALLASLRAGATQSGTRRVHEVLATVLAG